MAAGNDASDDYKPLRDPIPLSEHLNTAIRRINMGDTQAVGGLFGRWRELVGDPIADNVTPVRLDDKRLVVEVSEPAWATQFKFLEEQVIHTLREHLGDVVEVIDVRVSRRK